MATSIKSAASELLQQQINNTPKTALGKPTTVSRAANIPKVGLNVVPAPIGRPPGQAARIEEFKARLVSTKGSDIITKMMDIALTDSHPGQMAAIKMCVDRILPLSLFDKTAGGGNQTPTVSINITGFTGSTATITTGDIGSGANEDIIDV